MKLSRFEENKFPKKGIDGKYHILYKTTNTINNKFYIGIHSSAKQMDNYIGCGLIKNRVIDKNNKWCKISLKRSYLWRAALTYGIHNFTRANLFYFDNREDLINAKTFLIDKEFALNNWNYNSIVGGSLPPNNKGEKNGNFNNKWSDEKKKKLSEHFLATRNTKGENNSRALKCICLDLTNMSIKKYGCGKDMALDLKIALMSIYTWLRSNDHLSNNIRKKRYVFFKEEFYNQLVESNMLNDHCRSVIDRARLSFDLKKLYYGNCC